MAELKYNEPFCTIHFSELSSDEVQVDSFSGEEQISHLFEYHLNLFSMNGELNSEDILNKSATFSLLRPHDDPVKIHGIVRHFEQRGRFEEYYYYYAVLSPKLWRLNLIYQSEVYQNMDMEALIKKVLETSGFSGDDFEINLSQSYPQQEYIVQYRETNLNFLNRRLEHFGIYYYFDHRDGNDIVIFTDTNHNLPSIAQSDAVLYHAKQDPLAESELIRSFISQEKVVTGLVRLKDYNYLYPEKQLMAESRIDSEAPGMYYEYGDHFEDDDQAAFLARVRNEEIIAGSKLFLGESDCRLFHAGFRFAMSQHYRSSWDGEYILTRMVCQGDQRGLKSVQTGNGDKTPSYANEFTAIPVDIVFRPLRRTPVPRISGIMSARTESSTGDEYAYIDDHGRYHAKMLFDLTDRRNGEATLPIRQIQPYSGPNYGTHFPSHAGTELVWACVDGNVDRPISLGTVPNPSNISPSVMDNKAQSVIRTAGQNELTLDDTTQHENIYLHGTKDWTIDIVNDKRQEIGHDETLHVGHDRAKTVDVNQSEKIGQDKTIDVGRNHTETINNDKQLKVLKNHDERIGENMTITVGKNLTQEVQKDKRQQIDGNESVQVGENYSRHVGEDYSCYSGKMMNISTDDNYNLYGDKKGYIEMRDQLVIKCGASSIILKSNGQISIKGSKITIQASGDVIIKGAQIKEN